MARGNLAHRRALRMESLEPRALLAVDLTLVKDIGTTPQLPGLSPAELTTIGDVAYFSGSSPTYGRELWRTDGTSQGTSLVRDIYQGSGGSSPQQLTVVGDDLYFVASDGLNGQEIWKSDGTAEGTVLLKVISTAAGTPPPFALGVVGDALYFSAYDGQWGLWTSDGTEAGTVKLQSFAGNVAGYKPTHFTAVGELLYFTADDGTGGVELWKSDGTSAGTMRVADIAAGATSSNPTSLVSFNDVLYFAASDGVHGSELWTSDGTEAGTTLVKDVETGADDSTPTKFLEVNGILYFLTDPENGSTELWRTDGTAAGTVPVTGGVKDIVVFNDVLYAFGSNAIYRTDGTPTGIEYVADFQSPFYGAEIQPTVAGSTLYYVSYDSLHRNEIWKTDGTVAGTMLLKDLNTTGISSRDFIELSALNGQLLFQAFTGLSGIDLWKSDGSEAGTVLVREAAAQTATSNPVSLTEFGDALYFVTRTGAGDTLWRTDGTEAGTLALKTITAGLIMDHRLTVVGDSLFFVASDGITGNELWKTDGSAAGTVLVKDIVAGTNGSFSTLTENESLVGVGDSLYFTLIRSHTTELWRSNGSETGTQLVKSFNTALPNNVGQLTDVNGELFFVGYEPSTGRELWKSDGTTEGTVRISDISSGPASSLDSASEPLLFSLGSTLLFPATRSDLGRELWKWDSLNGVSLVKDISAGSGSGLHPFPFSPTRQWAVSGGWVYFVATQGFTGGGISELWKSDGTAEGTTLVKDIRPGTSGSYPEQLTAVGDEVYFVADDGPHGRELWKSDGTEAGTFIVYESIPGELRRPVTLHSGTGGRLYFSVSVEGVGDELWTVNEDSRALLVGDVTGDAGGSSPGAPTVVGERLFFAATHQATGRELWTVDLSDPIALAGDYDGDGDADGSDFLTWQRALGSPAAPVGSGADGNRGGSIESGDLAVWKINFGGTPLGETMAMAYAATPIAVLADAALTELAGAWHVSRHAIDASWIQSAHDLEGEKGRSRLSELDPRQEPASRSFGTPAFGPSSAIGNVSTRRSQSDGELADSEERRATLGAEKLGAPSVGSPLDSHL